MTAQSGRSRVLVAGLVAGMLAGCAAPTPIISPVSAPTATATPAGTFGPGADGIGDPYYPKAGNGGYDVANYDLDLRYDPATDGLTGTATDHRHRDGRT